MQPSDENSMANRPVIKSESTAIGMTRREFCSGAGAAVGTMLIPGVLNAGEYVSALPSAVRIGPLKRGEDLFSYMKRVSGGFSQDLYQKIIGAANEFKEGDRIIGVAAADEITRRRARRLLLATRAGDIDSHPLFSDPLYDTISSILNPAARARVSVMTLRQLRDIILLRSESTIRSIIDGLSCDLAGCLVKVMSNKELITAGRRIFNPLPGSRIGESGYLGARIQPNSPTDNPDDIFWQVMSGFSYGVGDVVLGTNPVSSEPDSVARVEQCLLDIRSTFGIEEILPHSVLAHIDIQSLIEQQNPGTTGIWFQSLAGSTAVNKVFDVTIDKMTAHAAARTGKYGFYFETGQGADFTNGYGQKTDMVIHESRKYGFARYLKQKVADAQQRAGRDPAPWVHVNDVAGFIGPEVFRRREQLVRCCLEDIVMAKLQGITIGLDVCTTLHMDISLDDLEWCLDRIMPAGPAYLMALPTRMDPMLGYLSTSFQDHVRLRERFGCRINDDMADFFQRIGVVDGQGRPAAHYGRPLNVWLAYRRAKGDLRSDAEILDAGLRKMAEVRQRGVPLAEGYGKLPWELSPSLDREIRAVYADAKRCIRAELPADFMNALPQTIVLASKSYDRDDYILHPQTGEMLDEVSLRRVEELRRKGSRRWPVQIVISDGLNALALTDNGNLMPYLELLQQELLKSGMPAAPYLIVVRHGRVRIGYRIGEILFREPIDSSEHRAIIHIIGERPGSMHHTFSAYLTAPPVKIWSSTGQTDHNITRLVSGIAADALDPLIAARLTVKIMKELFIT